ncbi:hypothetical protein HX837_06380 [Marine Group I thaumarchaeote]|uniref:Uncharacterized protein n=1 Tax=Marine Group I thaumarchaeote TaxID=2511932 RepID=A0A7K4MR23_9ARCH|nr:hypothetical protein [Marine Group I thaumarchaeote]
MIDTNTESFGMVLLIACMIGVVASIVGVRMTYFSRKTKSDYQNLQTTLRNYKLVKI